jgi:hypothetical protein
MTVVADVPEQRAEDILFAAADVCRMACISYRNLDYWLRAKHVDLDEDHERLRTPGSGFPRRFTFAEAQRFALLGRLVRAGLRVEVAAATVRKLEANKFEPVLLGDGVLVQVTL